MLSAIVIHAVWGLVSISAFRRYAAVCRNDFLAAVVAFLGVLVLGPLNGLLLAIGQSLLGLVYRSMQVEIDVRAASTARRRRGGRWRTTRHHPHYRGVTVLRPDGPLFWANANSVVQHVEVLVLERRHLRAVVLDLEATNQMDTTTAERLQQMMLRLRLKGIDLYLVRVFGNVRDVLTRSGFLDELGSSTDVWHSIAAGVKAARAAPPIVVALPETTDAELDSVDTDLTESVSRTRTTSTSPRTACTGSRSPRGRVPEDGDRRAPPGLIRGPSASTPALVHGRSPEQPHARWNTTLPHAVHVPARHRRRVGCHTVCMTTLPTLAVTGSTGALGGLVARDLADRGVPQRLLRVPLEHAPRLLGAVPVHADYADRDAALQALEGVRTLLMVSGRERRPAPPAPAPSSTPPWTAGVRARRLHLVRRRRRRRHLHPGP